MEIWKPVVGYEGLYEVSSLGRIKSVKRIVRSSPKVGYRVQYERILSWGKKENGYYIVNLWRDGIGKSHYVHRLVGEAFIPNPKNKPQIDHIDRDKSNNCVENLRWATQSEQEYNKRPDRKKTGPKPKAQQ